MSAQPKPFYQTLTFHILLFLAVYFTLKYFIPYGRLLLYPVTLLVTFLHEFGHALGAVLTGGEVRSVQINPDGSGYTLTAGGWRAITIMGGYLGSALFGNLLFYIGIKKASWAKYCLYVLAAVMVFTAFWWFNSLFSSMLLLLYAAGIWYLAAKVHWQRELVMFLGLSAIIYIIEDIHVGPSSDLRQYARLFVVIPVVVWKYIWWLLVLAMCYFNFKKLFRNKKDTQSNVVN